MKKINKEAGSATRILLHSPDITLKGKNQDDFQNALCRNVRMRLRRAGITWQVGTARGRVHVNTSGCNEVEIAKVVNILKDLAGVSSLTTARWLKPNEMRKGKDSFNWELLEKTMIELARTHYLSGASFAIRMNRVDKRLPFNSQEIQIRLGNAIRANTDWERVQLKKPDRTFFIDAYPDGMYLYGKKITGHGGLPVGTGGKVLGLLSGGIDSPVASFMLAKRGCNLDLFHLSAGHIREDDFIQSVVARLAQQLSRYTLRSRLYVVPYTYFDLKLKGRRSGYELVLFRRFMMRCAEVLATRIWAGALVAGDSLGQVASQTLENMVTASAPIKMPVFRPLVGLNKQEIISIARKIDTYGISIEPYKDCCALVAQNPKTRSTDEDITRLEQKLLPDYMEIIEKTYADMLCFEFVCGEFLGKRKK